MKVSREGIVLIKSFEGFRPRAVRSADGRWIIGYGHFASAREGLTVSEQDAELLLQYDLLPVVRALNDDVSAPLNQHQFDALASFAISVGVDRFLASDVRGALNAGRVADAADAMTGWPETPGPETALRRRFAERALFVARPEAPMALADLLAAPLDRPSAEASPAGAASPAVQYSPPSTPQQERLAAYAPRTVGPLPGADGASEYQPVEPFPFSDDARPDSGPHVVAPLTSPEPGPSPFPQIEDAPLTIAATKDGAFISSERPGLVRGAPSSADSDQQGEDDSGPPVVRHEVEPPRAGRFDWGQTGMFVIMGLFGLIACAFSAAGFRLALAEPSPMGETTVAAWALAIIGVITVAVSAWNLYVRWGKPD